MKAARLQGTGAMTGFLCNVSECVAAHGLLYETARPWRDKTLQMH